MDEFEQCLQDRIDKGWKLWNGSLHPSQRTGGYPAILAKVDYLQEILDKYRELTDVGINEESESK